LNFEYTVRHYCAPTSSQDFAIKGYN